MSGIVLRSRQVELTLDPEHGAEILSLIDRRTGIDVLFSTPWRERAESVLRGEQNAVAIDSMGRWLETYRGGWQTLLPHGGAERVVGGATMGFHGEASRTRWSVLSASEASVRLTCALFTVPLIVDRVIAVEGSAVTITDELRNASTTDLRVDYVQHPAFGGPFLEGDVRIATGARRFVPDGDTLDARGAGERQHIWPIATLSDGTVRDLSVVAPLDASESIFGTLVDLAEPWATISNRDLGLAVRLEWDATEVPYAWFWQELNHMPGWPWFRRARVIAIEPASTPTGGPDRASGLVVPAGASRSVWVRLSLHPLVEQEDGNG